MFIGLLGAYEVGVYTVGVGVIIGGGFSVAEFRVEVLHHLHGNKFRPAEWARSLVEIKPRIKTLTMEHMTAVLQQTNLLSGSELTETNRTPLILLLILPPYLVVTNGREDLLDKPRGESCYGIRFR